MTATTRADGDNGLRSVANFGHDAIAAEIRIVQSVQTQRGMPVLLFGNAMAVAIVSYVDWAATVSSYAVYFLAGLLLLLLPMLRSFLRLRGMARPQRVSRRRIRLIEYYSLLLGLIWGVAFLLLMSQLKPIDAVIVSMAAFYLAFGAVAQMPSLPKASAAYFAPLMAAVLTGFYFNDVLGVDLLALLGVATFTSLPRSAWQGWQDAAATVRLGQEKLKAEAEAHERETEAIRSILEAIPFPLVVTNETGALHASSQARRQFGVSGDAPLNLDIREFFADPTEQERMAELQDAHGRLEEYEVQLKNAEGESFWASLSTLPMNYEGQDCWLNAIYVIDDRKRAEAALDQKTFLLSHVLDTVAQGVVKFDTDRKLVIWNQHYQDALDLPGELINTECSINDLALYIARRGDYGDGDPEALAEQRVEFLFRGAETRSEIVVGNQTYDALCQPTDDGGIVITYTDVTTRKWAEQKLNDSREVLQALADNMPAFVSFKDVDGRFQFVNKVFEKWVCIDRTEVAGKTVHDLYEPEEAARFAAQDRACLESREVVSREIPLTYPDGETRNLVSTRFPVLGAGGDLLGLGTVNYDITERMRAAAELLEAKQNAEEQAQVLEAVSSQLAKYISPQLYRAIFSGEQKVEIESKRKKLTVFFSDIADFTEITDQLESEELTALLNQYLTEMSRIAQEYGANFDKFIGDAMMFYFGDPESRGVKEDAAACVRMALAMQRRVGELQQEWRELGVERPFEIRIGINTGYCTVGNFGSEDRMDYTIIGSEVNLAARLQSHAEVGGILLANETYALVKDWLAADQGDALTVKGFAKPVTTFRVEGARDELAAEGRITHHESNGMALTINHGRLSDADKAEAVQALEAALARLKD